MDADFQRGKSPNSPCYFTSLRGEHGGKCAFLLLLPICVHLRLSADRIPEGYGLARRAGRYGRIFAKEGKKAGNGMVSDRTLQVSLYIPAFLFSLDSFKGQKSE